MRFVPVDIGDLTIKPTSARNGDIARIEVPMLNVLDRQAGRSKPYASMNRRELEELVEVIQEILL